MLQSFLIENLILVICLSITSLSFGCRCCVKGSLLEVNERLIGHPELLISSVKNLDHILNNLSF